MGILFLDKSPFLTKILHEKSCRQTLVTQNLTPVNVCYSIEAQNKTTTLYSRQVPATSSIFSFSTFFAGFGLLAARRKLNRTRRPKYSSSFTPMPRVNHDGLTTRQESRPTRAVNKQLVGFEGGRAYME
ncbi:hypothetical protein GWI33_016883 [Rhynchophorus ferrugineus]|uniref:Uncharacterized protein n=1 Tax=Rhynchophorus ferrugineus TaxID=354439 RepID=A0A834HXU5_RHYFE|nr:hypothetical protein GWI33_016883 [Rhynchophorus ferrugineus]